MIVGRVVQLLYLIGVVLVVLVCLWFPLLMIRVLVEESIRLARGAFRAIRRMVHSMEKESR